ncbi:Membrane protein involved in the export of O-antigen and teichoic acid [Rhodococcus qingshengii]|jgi:hypothetical protein|nr:Membrane protein involved in the export of O-antigen and teichoic acid [Rhodococcus qingshengii]
MHEGNPGYFAVNNPIDCFRWTEPTDGFNLISVWRHHVCKGGGVVAGLKLRVLFSAGDQVLSSVSNALILFAMAGPSSVSEFGLAILVFSILTAALGFVRGAVGTPLLLMSAHSRNRIRAESRHAISGAATFGVLVGIVALGVSVFLHEPQVGIAYAVAAPVVLAQDALRFTAMSMGEPEHAFFSDALWASAAFGVLVVTWIRPEALSIAEMIWLWSVAGGLALVYLMIRVQTLPRLTGLYRWWASFWTHRIRFGFESGIDQLAAIVIVAVSTAFIGTVAAASLRGAVTVLGPFAVLISSLPLIVIPESVRAGHTARQVWSTLRYAAWLTSAMAATIGFAAPFLPDALGRVVLGESWAEARHVLPFLGLEYAAICWIAGVYNLYRTQGASGRLLKLRIVQSLTAIVICSAAAALTGTAVGVAIGLAVSSVLVAVCLVVAAQRKHSGREDPASVPSTADRAEPGDLRRTRTGALAGTTT